MDLTVNTSRFAAYFAFGIGMRPSQDATARVASATPRQNGPIIDVKPEPVASQPRQFADSFQSPPRRSNIFAPPAPSTPKVTYAPPAAAGQAARIIASPQELGQIIDTWA